MKYSVFQSYLEIGEGFGGREMSEEEKVRMVVLLCLRSVVVTCGWLVAQTGAGPPFSSRLDGAGFSCMEISRPFHQP